MVSWRHGHSVNRVQFTAVYDWCVYGKLNGRWKIKNTRVSMTITECTASWYPERHFTKQTFWHCKGLKPTRCSRFTQTLWNWELCISWLSLVLFWPPLLASLSQAIRASQINSEQTSDKKIHVLMFVGEQKRNTNLSSRCQYPVFPAGSVVAFSGCQLVQYVQVHILTIWRWRMPLFISLVQTNIRLTKPSEYLSLLRFQSIYYRYFKVASTDFRWKTPKRILLL